LSTKGFAILGIAPQNQSNTDKFKFSKMVFTCITLIYALIQNPVDKSMGRQDPNPLPYGALPYFQIHYLIEPVKISSPSAYMAKARAKTEGHFEDKKVIDIEWIGGRLAQSLAADKELTEMLKPFMVREGEISIDPQKDRVRLYTKWKREDRLQFDPQFFQVVERIANAIKKLES
jgi:hypothetical protein